MAYNAIEVPFTNELRCWLITMGYTHILNEDSYVEDDLTAPYVITPLRPLDPRFKIGNNKDRIERITANDVIIMAEGDPLIRFVAILPIDEFQAYLNLR